MNAGDEPEYVVTDADFSTFEPKGLIGYSYGYEDGHAAGYRRALEDAADAMEGGTTHQCFRPQGCVECGRQQERDGRISWLRAQAAAVAPDPRETKD